MYIQCMPHEMSHPTQLLRTRRVTAFNLSLILRILEMYHNVLLEDVFSRYMAHAPFVREFLSAYTKKTYGVWENLRV
jgi:hypothetical protein